MWQNRPAIEILLQSPCHNCDKRQKPKTCEKDCELWAEYQKNKKELEKEREIRKEVNNLFASKYKNKR